jgi:N-acyl amino acid synthase of PEP-CTERM/exosortase system
VEPEEPPIPAHERRHRDAVFIALVKATYQASKRLGATHWIVAMEKPLLRRTARLGVPFRVAGPEVDYYGAVAPYILNLAELDQMILGQRFAMLEDFLHGLEPEFWPTLDELAMRPLPIPG